MAVNDAVINTQNLSKQYNQVMALDRLTLQVPRNSIFGFLGPNGAGKSTTIKLLLGLIKPTEGTAQVFGSDIGADSVAIRRRVGYLAQEPRYYENMTARETLRYTARFFYTGPAAKIEERVREMLDLAGLADRADRPIKGYSGGERQRLGIAQAQINYPDLLILDEPAASLDPQGRHDVLTVMERLRQHTTIFYSTHILEDVQRVSDTVAILNRGRLVAQAPIGELLSGTGGGGTTFLVSLRGDPRNAQALVSSQPWVTGVQSGFSDGITTLAVEVSDPASAEVQLLRLILNDHNLAVTYFGRRVLNLEQVFLSIVNRSNSNEQ